MSNVEDDELSPARSVTEPEINILNSLTRVHI